MALRARQPCSLARFQQNMKSGFSDPRPIFGGSMTLLQTSHENSMPSLVSVLAI
jgi:hypothetical protein